MSLLFTFLFTRNRGYGKYVLSMFPSAIVMPNFLEFSGKNEIKLRVLNEQAQEFVIAIHKVARNKL